MSRKNRAWLEAVAQIQYCVLCGSTEGLQVAHRNEGKGVGLKAPDVLTARLCQDCHYEIDNGRDMPRADRRALMDRAIVLTLEQLSKIGALRVA